MFEASHVGGFLRRFLAENLELSGRVENAGQSYAFVAKQRAYCLNNSK
jgi:hypothetical protein